MVIYCRYYSNYFDIDSDYEIFRSSFLSTPTTTATIKVCLLNLFKFNFIFLTTNKKSATNLCPSNLVIIIPPYCYFYD